MAHRRDVPLDWSNRAAGRLTAAMSRWIWSNRAAGWLTDAMSRWIGRIGQRDGSMLHQDTWRLSRCFIGEAGTQAIAFLIAVTESVVVSR